MAIRTVGPTSTYTSIAAAMLASGPGDTIVLQSGYSGETATVTHSGMTIAGDATSLGITLQLAPGIATFTAGGTAPFTLVDAPDGNGIVGNGGDNLITVTAGVDAVDGGAGQDRLVVDYRLATGAVTGDSTSNFTEAGGGGRSVTVTSGTIEDFTVLTGAGADTITVGDGANVISVGAGPNTVTAGNGNNTVTGGADADTVTTGSGNDIIDVGAGTNTVSAGQGANSIVGGAGADTLTALDGGNYIDGGNGTNILTSGAGNDTLQSGTGADTIEAGAGNDQITVRGGADTVQAGAGSDRLTVDYSALTANVTGGITGGDLVAGYVGRFAGLAAAVVDFQGVESFIVTTGSGNDVILTGGGDDVLSGGLGDDSLDAGSGNDTIRGDDGDDTLLAGDGADLLIGGLGNDRLEGGADNDILNDIEGVNLLLGGDGDDTLFGAGSLDGGNGNDRLTAASYATVMTGGAGQDLFIPLAIFGAAPPSSLQVITDFAAGAGGDRLDLSNWLTSSNAIGYTGQDPFAAGYIETFQDGVDTIVRYDSTGGGDSYVGGIRLLNVDKNSLVTANLSLGGVFASTDANVGANTVLENAAIGALVGLTAQANDPDAADVVSYSLANDAGGRFAVNAVSGVVTVAGALDFETAAAHSITVRATSSDTSFADSAFTIAVGDVNELPAPGTPSPITPGSGTPNPVTPTPMPTPVTPDSSLSSIDVFRFYETRTGTHMYTTSTEERDAIQSNLPNYRLEGVAFQAVPEQLGSDAVYRFFKPENGTHFFTASVAERDSVMKNLPNYTYEGTGFHASDRDGASLTEVYRFFKPEAGTHFYTSSLAEKEAVQTSLPNYQYEGIGFYVPDGSAAAYSLFG